LLEELLERCDDSGVPERLSHLAVLERQCMQEDPSQRPNFKQLVEQLEHMTSLRSVSAG
jgi:hypothetical protein